MRIIAGELGGRSLRAPRGRATRPTSDRVREALFAVLGEVSGARVLDLFAGSGALAIEALSRGARGAEIVDSSRTAVAVALANVDALGVGDRASVVCREALAFLGTARRGGRQYDLVFVDPPYDQASRVRERLSAALPPVLAPGARVVAESDRRVPLALRLPLLDERRYGDTLIQIHGDEGTDGT